MQKIKKYKWYILLPIVIIILTVTVCVVVENILKQENVEEHIELGKRYLMDLNYSGAVLEFKNAIVIDPNNEEARIQLAEAYYQSNDLDMSAQVLKDVINEESPNIRMSEELIQVYLKSDNNVGALTVIQDLIEYTDDEKYYEMKEEIVGEVQQASHSYAKGTDHELMIINHKLMSRGRNVLGQLGTSLGLGDKTYQQENFRDAGFSQTPHKVFTAGRTGYVVDTEGKLWAAGENRWGQKGISYGSLLPESGWVKVEDGDHVSKVAGTTGNVYVLKENGSLWHAGGTKSQKLEPVKEFSVVLDVYEHNSMIYVHTAKGEVYVKDMRNASAWNLLKKNVRIYSITENEQCVWIDIEGNIGLPRQLTNVPENWTLNADGTYRADVNIVDMICVNNQYFFLTSKKELLQLSPEGMIHSMEMEAEVENIYREADKVIAELTDGKLLNWDSNLLAWKTM